MNNYAEQLIAALTAAGTTAYVNPTGGGCEEIHVSTGLDQAMSLTDGHAGLPDGESFDGCTVAVYSITSEEHFYIDEADPTAAAERVLELIKAEL